MNTKQLAEKLNISVRAAQSLIKRGLISGVTKQIINERYVYVISDNYTRLPGKVGRKPNK